MRKSPAKTGARAPHVATVQSEDFTGMKKERKIIRTLFTKNCIILEKMLEDRDTVTSTAAQFKKVEELKQNLKDLDIEIRKCLRDGEEKELESELENAFEYQSQFITLDSKYNEYRLRCTNNNSIQDGRRNFRLPKLQFITFDGDLKNWLAFWGQFSKIDADTSIDLTDKYQYLLQAMKDGSEPKFLVESFTPTSYTECLCQLKARYAREELLIQVYVRELLAMVNRREHNNITVLYDKLSAQLRALETLGVAKDKFAAFLLPMIESAIPQAMLQIWERAKKDSTNTTSELSELLTFLRKEVESEQRVSLAKKTFSNDFEASTSQEPTASCLLTGTPKKTWACIWCDKDSHCSIECYKVNKMSLEERRDYLRKKKACVLCLRPGHYAKICRANIRCIVCGQRHSVVFCSAQKSPTNNLTNSSSKTSATCNIDDPPSTAANFSAAPRRNTCSTLLQTVSVIVCNGENQVTIRAMFDNGAQRSYLREDIARKLNILSAGNETISHALFGGVQLNPSLHNLYRIKVMDVNRNYSFPLTVLGQKCICRDIPKYTFSDLTPLLAKHNITLSDNNKSDDIGLLIGADFSGLVLTGEMVKLHESLVAIKTKLGWTLQGKINGPPSTSLQSTTNIALFSSSDISNFWSLETLGIRDPVETKTKQQSEEEVLAAFEESVTVNKEGRFEVNLPWKVCHDELLNNFELASRRLESVTKKLQSIDLYEGYNKVFEEWLTLGIIEVVLNPQIHQESSHYLAHHPVIREKSLTTRIRPVFNASVKDKNGKSLNLCLSKGVNLLDQIPKLLNGFRRGVIGVTADITKAFLQISVLPEDRDMLRFLWWNKRGELTTYRHCRVMFGLTCSPFLLSATIQHHLNQVTGGLRDTATLLANSLYVDNCVTSMDTVEAAQKFHADAVEVMSKAKFNLTQWVISPLPGMPKNDIVSVLGLDWHTAEDQLSCHMDEIPPPCEIGKITKRRLLSLAQRVYDPIGFSSAVMLVPRLILQEAWRRKLDWDVELPSDLRNKFMSWYESLSALKSCRIPRRFTDAVFNECALQLHMFCDASGHGYAACVYLRAESKGKVSLRLISAKSRIAPPGKLTIPRLELLAALIGSRLLSSVRKDLNLKCEKRCWTDSGVALCWIKRELPWNTYIGNRVKEIRLNTDVNNWFHIPGTSNWADMASRGCNAAHLVSSRWIEGPTWLKWMPEKWPSSPLIVDETQVERELKKTLLCNTNISLAECMTSKFLYFSKYTKIIRMVAWMFRFVHNISSKNKLKGELSFEEYEESEKKIIRMLQAENKEYIAKKIQGLTHCYDKNGLIRIKTKLLLTDVPESTKFPVVVPATSALARRLVEQRHAQLQHAGLGTVMADLRSKYWVIGARNLVKSVIAKCNTCMRYRAKPVCPPAAPLPPERTQCSAAYEVTGVDLMGPLYLRGGSKCWVVLYTCAVYRAVHFELTQSLSTEAFIMTLRRFIARRGRVRILISDNGTNFVGTNNLLSALDWDEIKRFSTIQSITWKFNAPTAAWWGGFWERLIRIVKDLLKRILGRATVTYVELETILCDCEATMNRRPLTYLEDNTTFSLEPLTPAHFLQPLPSNDVSDFDQIDGKSLNKRLRYIQKLREDFRQRFRSEYITTLVQRGREKKGDVKVGDVVLIETEDRRIKWPLGVVEEVYQGKDGVSRTAKLRTSVGYKVRPFQRLFLLEAAEAKPPEQIGKSTSETIPTTLISGDTPEVRPQAVTRSGRVVKIPSRFNI